MPRDNACVAGYAVDRHKVTTIPHGATVPNSPRAKRPSRPTILTWGLLGPGKGIERVIDAMPSLRNVPGRPRYLVAGPTHPKVLAAEARRTAMPGSNRPGSTAWLIRSPSTPATTTTQC